MKIRPNCAARTVEADIRPIAEISQRVGIAIEAATFLGSSPIRRLVEDWTVDHLERTTEKAVKFVVEHNLPSMFVTEDTIRTDRETVKRLYSTAITTARAPSFSATPLATPRRKAPINLIKFAVDEIVKPSGQDDPHRLARSQRSRSRHRKLTRRHCRRRKPDSRRRKFARRTRRQYSDGTNARQSPPDGPDRSRSFAPQGILRKSRRRDAHHHPAQLSGYRSRCFPHRDRRPRRRHRQSFSQQIQPSPISSTAASHRISSVSTKS